MCPWWPCRRALLGLSTSATSMGRQPLTVNSPADRLAPPQAYDGVSPWLLAMPKLTRYWLNGKWVSCDKDPVVSAWIDSKGRGSFKITQGGIKLWRCYFCRKWGGNRTHWCAGCKMVSYCSLECHRKDWKIAHRYECGPPPLEDATSSSDSGASEEGWVKLESVEFACRCQASSWWM